MNDISLAHQEDMYRPWTWSESIGIYNLLPVHVRQHLQMQVAQRIETEGTSKDVSIELILNVIPSGDFIPIVENFWLDCTEIADRWSERSKSCGGCHYSE